MSVNVMSWVFDHSPYDGKQLLIHLVLADHANKQGVCWPSQSTIAASAKCSVEYVRTTVRQMVTEGYLVIEKQASGRGNSSRYRLLAKAPEPVDDSTGETPKSFGSFEANPQIEQEEPPNPASEEPSLTEPTTPPLPPTSGGLKSCSRHGRHRNGCIDCIEANPAPPKAAPPWCGQCDPLGEKLPSARFVHVIELVDGVEKPTSARCPRCHPGTQHSPKF